MSNDLDLLEEDNYSEEASVVEKNVEVESSHGSEPDPNIGPVAYRMRPSLHDTFKAKAIKLLIQETLQKTLRGKRYNVEDAGKWTREISDNMCKMVKDLNMPRYKHIVQVTVGQQLGAGFRNIAKCSWDAECDSHTSDVFSNASMFCVCTVFGIYLY